jgi:peptidoglycan hydrolase CwlO-like protein
MMKHSFKRDPRTSVLINNDDKEYKEYQHKLDTINKLNSMQNEINYLKTEINILNKQFTKFQEKFKDV